MTKRLLFLGLILALVLPPIPVEAQTSQMGACPFSANSLKAAYTEMLTVSTTALPFTASKYNPGSGAPKAVCATVVVNTNSISWWPAGTTPTASDGVITDTGGSFSIGPSNLATFLMIRAEASDSAVAVIYQVPVN